MEHLNKFVVQLEWTESWEELSNEEMGILFKNFIAHTKGLEINKSNRMVNVAWNSVKNQVERMTEKYLKDIENGKRGGAPKGNKNATKQPKNNPQTTQEQPKTTEEQPENEVEKQPSNNPRTTYKYKDKYNYKEKYNDKDIVKVDMNSLINSGEILDENKPEEVIDDFFNSFWDKRKYEDK